MGDRRPRRITPRKAACGGDAGKLGQAHADGGEAFPIEILRHLYRLETGGVLQIGDQPVHLLGRQLQDIAQQPQHMALIFEPVGDDVDAKVGAVVGDRRAVAIDDPATPGRDQRHVDAVAFAERAVPCVFSDGEPGHASGERDANRALQASQQDRAARKAVALRRLGHHARRLREGRALHSGSSSPASMAQMRAASGKSSVAITICSSRTVSTCAPSGAATRRPRIRQKATDPAAINQSCQKSR
ncbi:hypothetical protein D9M73_134150 [compost metagenome]